jgi:hypothetical protein
VYADWLQEHGQENYARFIRLQCAAAREQLWSAEANRLWEEIGRVWMRLDEEWWPATRDAWTITRWRANWLDAIHFARGFLSPGIRIRDQQFLAYSGADCHLPWAASPGCVLVLTPYGGWERLSSVPQFQRIEHISLSTRAEAGEPWETDWIPEGMVALLQAERLRKLRSLDLSALWLTQRAANGLLSASNLSSLEQLFVSFSDDPDPDPAATMQQFEARFKWVIRY